MIRNFLLADDDQDDTDLFGEALREIDPAIEFNFVHNGRELITHLQSGDVNPDVIFLDINMPEMNGWECLENMKKQSLLNDVPVIMYSTSSPGVYGKQAVKSGATGFYEKPTNFLQLKEFLKLIAGSSPETLIKTLKKLKLSTIHMIYTE